MNDPIKRDKAMDVLDDFQSDIENCVTDAYAIARQRMKAIPSADNEVIGKLKTAIENEEICKNCPTVEIITGENFLGAMALGFSYGMETDRPQGEWIWNENGMDWGIGCWCCSECGMRNPYIGSGDNALLSNPHNWAGSNFCPNCGADMRGERSGTDKDKPNQ